MSLQNFMTAVKTNNALQNDLANASKDSLIAIAKSHGFKVSEAELDKSINQKAPISAMCISTGWTAVCTV